MFELAQEASVSAIGSEVQVVDISDGELFVKFLSNFVILINLFLQNL